MPKDNRDRVLSPRIIQLLLVALFIIWSNSFTAIKHLREIFSPLQLVLARFLPVSLFALGYILASRKRVRESLEILKDTPVRIIGMGIVGIAGYNFFLYLGQSEIKPGAAALLTTLSPLFTLLLAGLFLKERIDGRKTGGILLAFAGLYLVVRYGRVGMGRITDIGNADIRYALISALAPLSWSIYTIIGKDLVKSRSPFLLTCLSIVVGIIPLLPALGGDFFHTFFSLNLAGWIALAYLSIMCTIVGFGIWNLGLKHLSATSVSSFIYLNPPFAAFFGWLLFGEEVTLFFLLGSAVVLAGLYFAQSRD
ncbi:MAG: DMT family transporter [Candidatus Krumholzibacteriota bacterium]|nr:DMT family transporter [Candidatus Krumholzibacteriota bacterium]